MNYLATANPSVTGTSLTVGSTICIPSCYYNSLNLNSACTSYTVKTCDTFSRQLIFFGFKFNAVESHHLNLIIFLYSVYLMEILH